LLHSRRTAQRDWDPATRNTRINSRGRPARPTIARRGCVNDPTVGRIAYVPRHFRSGGFAPPARCDRARELRRAARPDYPAVKTDRRCHRRFSRVRSPAGLRRPCGTGVPPVRTAGTAVPPLWVDAQVLAALQVTRGRPLAGLRSTSTGVRKTRLNKSDRKTSSGAPWQRQRPPSSRSSLSAISAARFSS